VSASLRCASSPTIQKLHSTMQVLFWPVHRANTYKHVCTRIANTQAISNFKFARQRCWLAAVAWAGYLLNRASDLCMAALANASSSDLNHVSNKLCCTRYRLFWYICGATSGSQSASIVTMSCISYQPLLLCWTWKNKTHCGLVLHSTDSGPIFSFTSASQEAVKLYAPDTDMAF